MLDLLIMTNCFHGNVKVYSNKICENYITYLKFVLIVCLLTYLTSCQVLFFLCTISLTFSCISYRDELRVP